MRGIVYLTLPFLLLFGFADDRAGGVARLAGILPDLLSALALLILLAGLARYRRLEMPARYVVVFALLALTIVFGVVLNAVPAGTVFAGLRAYYTYLPFFFLPAVYRMGRRDMAFLLGIILVIAIVQFPVAVYQRFVAHANLATGDVVTGTLSVSSVLSLFLIASMCVLIAFYFSGRIRGIWLVFLMPLLFIPATINETKATLVLFPVAVGLAAYYAGRQGVGKGRLLVLGAGMVVLLGAFVVVYDRFYQSEYTGPLLDKITSEEYLMGYLRRNPNLSDFELEKFESEAKPTVEGPRLAGAEPGRLDALHAVFAILQDEPAHLAFGLGIGNASVSAFDSFSGRYSELGAIGARMTALSRLLWELGVIGTGLLVLLTVFVLIDSIRLSRGTGQSAVIAAGWVGVSVLYIVGLAYKDLSTFRELVYPFWFFSGYIVTEYWRHLRSASQPAPERIPPGVAVSR